MSAKSLTIFIITIFRSLISGLLQASSYPSEGTKREMIIQTTEITASLCGSLTTVFTPPTTCLQNYYTGGRPTSGAVGQLGYDEIYGIFHNECYPQGFNPNRDIGPVGWYSPGVCPSGYSIGTVGTTPFFALETAYTDRNFSTSIISNKTTVWCCLLQVPSIDYLFKRLKS
jgi:hypothetical protein